MRRFLYCRDPLFVVGCVSYAVNRWWLKVHVPSVFLRSHFNDLLLVPCALPPVLLAHRWMKLRQHDRMPLASEIAFHLAIWCVLFEILGPAFVPHTTADPWDMLAYCVGGLLAGLWWWLSSRRVPNSHA